MQVANGMGGNTLREKLIFIDNAIKALNEQDCNLIKGIFFDGISVVKIAESLFIHRVTAYRRADAIVKNMAKVYEMQFGS